MALSRVVLRIQASLIGHLSIKINAYFLLLRAVNNIEWGQERSVSHCSTNIAHSLPEIPSLLGPSRSSAECLPGLKVKYTDSIRKISDFPQNLGKLSACARNWYQALLSPPPRAWVRGYRQPWYIEVIPRFYAHSKYTRYSTVCTVGRQCIYYRRCLWSLL